MRSEKRQKSAAARHRTSIHRSMHTCLRCLRRKAAETLNRNPRSRSLAAVSSERWQKDMMVPLYTSPAGSPEQDPNLLSGLLAAIRSRAPRNVIRQLSMLETGQAKHTIDDVHLQAIIRSLRPHRYFGAPAAADVHKIYRRRMTYLRNWLAGTSLKVGPEIFHLFLEEGRLDKAHDPKSELAQHTWEDMRAAGIQPDVRCYNSYMAAICSQPKSFEDFQLRRSEDNDSVRHRRMLELEQATKLTRRAVSLYHEMLRNQIEPNSMTIELLILALGYSENLAGLRSILSQTWNIRIPESDLEALPDQERPDEYEEEGIDLDDNLRSDIDTIPTNLRPALYPTQRTLTALAISLGANQQNRLALSAVEKVARVYGLPISTRVWAQLMKWASIDSERLQGYTRSGYPNELMQMAKEIYKTVPSVGMYNVLMQDYIRQERPVKVLEVLEEMLRTIEGNSEAERPMFKKNSRLPHAMAVASTMLTKVERMLGKEIRQVERRLVSAKLRGGEDEIRLRELELSRRVAQLREVKLHWAKRLRACQDVVKRQAARQTQATLEREASRRQPRQ